MQDGCVTVESQGYSAGILTRFGHIVVVVVVVVANDRLQLSGGGLGRL